LNLPLASHHSITSSASNWIELGTTGLPARSRPSPGLVCLEPLGRAGRPAVQLASCGARQIFRHWQTKRQSAPHDIVIRHAPARLRRRSRCAHRFALLFCSLLIWLWACASQRLAIVALELAFWLSLGSEHIASHRVAKPSNCQLYDGQRL